MVMTYIGVPKEQKALSRRGKQLEKINQGGKTLMSLTNDSRFSRKHMYDLFRGWFSNASL